MDLLFLRTSELTSIPTLLTLSTILYIFLSELSEINSLTKVELYQALRVQMVPLTMLFTPEVGFTLKNVRIWGMLMAGWLTLSLQGQEHSSPPTDIKFSHISEGLSQNTVTCIAQDVVGYMWFGTRNGLNRYDGIDFSIYEYDPDDSTSISSNYINSIFLDSHGRLWVGAMGGGLNMYDRNKDAFTHWKSDPEEAGSLSDDWVNVIYEDRDHRLWIGTENGGLNLMNEDGKTFTVFQHDPLDPASPASNRVSSLIEDGEGHLLIGYSTGQLDELGHDFEFSHFRGEVQESGAQSIECMFEDMDGNIWLGTDIGVEKAIKEEGNYRFLPIDLGMGATEGKKVFAISEDDHKRLWIGIENGGLTILDRKNNQQERYLPDPKDPKSLGSNSIWAIYRDNLGAMWLGARNRGISKWDQYEHRFNHHRSGISGYHFANKDVTCFLEDHAGNIWIGTDGGGLNVINPDASDYTHFYHDPEKPNTISDDAIISLFEDSERNLWVGTWNGLNRYDESLNTFVRYKHDPEDETSISGDRVWSMIEDSYGDMWLGTRASGLNRYDRERDAFEVFHTKGYEDDRHIGFERIFKIYEDSDSNIWLGSGVDGVDLMRRQPDGTFRYQHFRNDPGDPGTLSNNMINVIMESSKGDIWIGTWRGLNRYDKTTRTFERYTRKNGLPDNVINGILEDGSGILWISTNQGLSTLNPDNGNIKNYTTEDGLQAMEFIRGAYYKTKNGEFFFGGINGFNAFFPEQVKENPHVPEIVLTNFKLFNERIIPERSGLLDAHVNDVREIEVAYNQNHLSFEFTVLNYSQSAKNRYSYYLEGYDHDWTELSNQRTATYEKLPPGEFLFHVRGTNNDGIFSFDRDPVRIIINPPWWKTWWAYSIYALIILTVILWGRQNIIRRERLKSKLRLERMELQKMQEVNQMKSNFFANISHEFRTPLTLILGPLRNMYANTFAGNTKKQLRMMIRSGERLLSLVNELLDLSKIEANSLSLNAREEDLKLFLHTIFLSFKDHAHSRHVEYKFQPADNNPSLFFDAEKLEKVISNLISNALKFAEGGTVTLGTRLPDDKADAIEIYVRDTGIGIPADAMPYVFDRFYQVDHSNHQMAGGTGLGLALSRELVELHGGTLSVDSREGEWTTFSVFLPMGSDHLTDQQLTPGASVNNPPSAHQKIELSSSTSDQWKYAESQSKIDAPLILIVEDNIDMRHFIEDQFAERYRTITAEDGLEGWKKCLANAPDLVVSDVAMPRKNGIELCHQIKQDERTAHIPVLILTSRATSEDQLTGLEEGADDYVTKPFDPKILLARAENIIATRRVLRSRFGAARPLTIEPSQVTVTSVDEEFLNSVLKSIESNISNPDYRVQDLSRDVAMSRMHLYRKIKAVTGMTVVEFIRTMRLKRAAQLILQNQSTIAEITYQVGFSDLQYFRKCFRKLFGCTPSEYATQADETTSIIEPS